MALHLWGIFFVLRILDPGPCRSAPRHYWWCAMIIPDACTRRLFAFASPFPLNLTQRPVNFLDHTLTIILILTWINIHCWVGKRSASNCWLAPPMNNPWDSISRVLTPKLICNWPCYAYHYIFSTAIELCLTWTVACKLVFYIHGLLVTRTWYRRRYLLSWDYSTTQLGGTLVFHAFGHNHVILWYLFVVIFGFCNVVWSCWQQLFQVLSWSSEWHEPRIIISI
jgi:hypothetical protein